jgi:hypothetical protein
MSFRGRFLFIFHSRDDTSFSNTTKRLLICIPRSKNIILFYMKVTVSYIFYLHLGGIENDKKQYLSHTLRDDGSLLLYLPTVGG